MSKIQDIKARIGGDFSSNMLTEADLATGFKVLLGYYDMEVPDDLPDGKDPAADIKEQAEAQAKMIVHFVQNTAAPKEE